MDKNIAFLSVFPPYRGGIAAFSDALFRELNSAADARAFNFKKLYPGILFPGSSQTVDNPDRNYEAGAFHPYNPVSWNGAADQILEAGCDCLLYSYWHPFVAPAYTRVLKRCKKKKPGFSGVCLAHNIIPHEAFPLKNMLTRRMLNHSDLTVVLSNQTEEEFRELAPSCDYAKLFHPIYELEEPEAGEAEIRKKYGLSEEDKIILFMGLVRRYKGVDLLVEALNEMDFEEHRLKPFIVGEFYTDREALLGPIKDEHRPHYTVMDEFVSEESMAELLTVADLLVLPYRKASQSGVLANAIYFRLPALVADQPGLTEHIEHMENGMIFRTGDAQDLRDKMATYLSGDLKHRFSRNLTELRDALSWPKFTRRLTKAVQRLG